ncbi:MAG: glycosyltransferase [Alphaproteobacteria bacterium]|nr:glycosyltransferase [Alphaproteobacteria bacterium]
MIPPKVSVLTPIYNTNPHDLRAMMESILSQTFTDFEFIILNDSPENTELEKIVKSYDDKRIKYFVNERNIGITQSRNKLIDLAQGEYLAIADHDDISMPNRLEKENDFLDTNPHVGVVGGHITEIKDGKETSVSRRPIHDHDIKLSLINDKYVCNPVHSGCMIRKCVLINSGVRYNEKWSPCEDRMLFIDLIPHTCFHNLKDVVLKYVWTGNNTTLRQWQKMYDLPPQIVMNMRKKYPLYYEEWKYNRRKDTINQITKIKLMGFIPFIKIKSNHGQHKIYLFDFIQLFRCKYNK